VPKESEPYVQESIPAWHGPIKDPRTGRWISSHIMNQDFIAWVGQGTIADRTRERLGASDRGIALLRRRFFADLEALARGEDPKAIVRDREVNACIMLPVVDRASLTAGVTRHEFVQRQRSRRRLFPGLGPYVFQAGQPAEVKKAYGEAMGVTEED
jgi:5,5'-dehydrodivanillate O-demethylase